MPVPIPATPAPKWLRLHPDDDVAIAVEQLISGTSLIEPSVAVRGLIPPGHKVALKDLASGQVVRRYGQIIGTARQPIRAGEHVHSHNLAIGDFARDHAFAVDVQPVTRDEPALFQGIVRADGRVATRNFIGILTSVNCSATVARAIADQFRRDTHPQALAGHPNIDGVIALTHGAGCAIDAQGEGLVVLQRTLGGYARHANFAGIVIVGLGCEVNQVSALMASQQLQASPDLQVMTIQDSGGTTATIARGVAAIHSMLDRANDVHRQPVSAAHLCIGLQCGGSDGYSGITANPVLGAAIDRLIRQGGTAILSETPEIYGAEHLLTRRAINEEVGRKLVRRVQWWEAHCARHGASLDNNPSAGNKAGGLTTILEKSLGAVAKAGSTNLMAVYEYAEPVTAKGLVFMDAPGYDPVSSTGQVASGANLICFTTGRGSAFGCAPAPSIKLATNTALWNRQRDDMDINCGRVLDGESIEQLGEELFDLLLATASGTRSRSELHGYGQSEFVPWQLSVIT